MGGCVFNVLKQHKQAHTQWVLVFFTFLLPFALPIALISTCHVSPSRFRRQLYRLYRNFTITNLYEKTNMQNDLQTNI